MFFDSMIEPSYHVYQDRRADLVKEVKKEYHDVKNGLVVFFASLENAVDIPFRQDGTFYYFTGIQEGGFVISIDLEGSSGVFVPNCNGFKKKWTGVVTEPTQEYAEKLSFSKAEFLGDEFKAVSVCPYAKKRVYANLVKKMSDVIESGGKIFVLQSEDDCEYFEQRFILDRIKTFLPNAKEEHFVDISPLVAKMRRKKSLFEIGKISESINLTAYAHDVAARTIKNDALEREVQAGAEYIFTAAGAVPAYRTIVGSGQNGPILHYTQNGGQMKDGQLVIVDVGAKLDHYCADITRTYPVSGKFTERQRELYNIVLETQQYIASIAKPGYVLKTRKGQEHDKCLKTLTKKFLDDKGGYGKYFTHGIGHYLGLDVHDVGDPYAPLEEGDVITIEPGIYIPEEQIGIRIEDNYWITKDKAICLSDMIPSDADQIEEFMKSGLTESQ
ncbi:aminopeptidase P N-terminal domain-containing protein [Candidatus Dependentiae bacterium]